MLLNTKIQPKKSNVLMTFSTEIIGISKKVKITSKHKQNAQNKTEVIFDKIATKCDKKRNGFVQKIKQSK